MARAKQSNTAHETVSVSSGRTLFRRVMLGIFLGFASLAFAAYILVAWVEHQILTADNWVAYSSSLPNNKDVSWALADVVTTQVYKNVPIEEKISDALPPKASFLAGPLSDQLRDRTVKLVNRIVSSDTFSSLWTGANRLAIERFLKNARSTHSPSSPSAGDKFNINLDSIKPVLQKRLGSQANISPALQEKSKQAIGVSTDLHAKRERLWKAVKTTDFIFAVLPAIFITSVLGMLVFASDKRRAFIVLTSITVVLLLIELILIKYARQKVLDNVNHSQYIPAVSHIYDSLVLTLRNSAINGFIAWLVILVIALFAGPAIWAKSVRKALHLHAISTSWAGSWWRSMREFAGHYKYALWTFVIVVGLIYLAFISSATSVAIVNSTLLVVSGIFIVQLLAEKIARNVT